MTDTPKITPDLYVANLVERLRDLAKSCGWEYGTETGQVAWEAAAALEAPATELATVKAERDEVCAALAEAKKALEPFAWVGQWFFARDLPDETPVVVVEGAGKPFSLTRGMFKAAHTAHLALEGGE